MELNFRRSPETEALVRALRSLAKGESLTDGELSLQVGFDVTQYEPRVSTAREILWREGSGTVERIPKVGYVKLLDTAVVNETAPRARRKLQNAARRGATKLAGVEYDALPEGDKVSHNASQAYFGAVRLFSGPKAMAKIQEAAGNSVLPPRIVLKLFEK